MSKHFGNVTTTEGLIGAGVGVLLGGLIPVALRRMLTLSDAELAEKNAVNGSTTPTATYKGKWKDHIRQHASAYGLGAVAVATGIAYAFKRTRGVAGSIAIVGGATAVPRVIADYTLDKALLDKLVLEGYPSSRLGALRIANALGVLTTSPVLRGNRQLGVMTVEQLRGSPSLSTRDHTVKINGSAYGTTPISLMHRS